MSLINNRSQIDLFGSPSESMRTIKLYPSPTNWIMRAVGGLNRKGVRKLARAKFTNDDAKTKAKSRAERWTARNPGRKPPRHIVEAMAL